MQELQTTAVDLTDALPQDTFDLHILKPASSESLGWVITLAGPGHAKTIALNNASERRRLEQEARIEQSRVNGRKWKPDAKQPEESRREFVESLVARIVTWTPIKIGDQVIVFSESAAIDLLMQPRMGVFVAQIVDALVEERTFTKSSAPN